MDGFKGLVETYYGTEVLPVLPKSFQEAVITLSEAEPDYWKRFDISPSVMQRFAEYKKQVLANRNNKSALPGLLRRAYGCLLYTSSGKWDSNPRPLAWEANALPTELLPR